MKEQQTKWPAGIKRTKQREGVLFVLENSIQPLSATEICAKMETGGDSAWLSTVYRILEVFVNKGIVKKTNILNNEMAVYELSRNNHKHYAVCMNCHKVIAMDHCPLEGFTLQLNDKDFHVMGHNLEIYGLCKDCKPK